MKKTYINPNMVVVRLAMTQPLAGSPNSDLGNFYDEDAESAAMAKENSVIKNRSVWEEEW
ncbi:MAG: hypothetical protein J6W52_06250 [Bacteroidaceae bacterium]|nr:hypothetical protein [Bacteroidaceae bacterium]